MFAVPGWKISAPLKAQTTPAETKNTQDVGKTTQTTPNGSKKRKRGSSDDKEVVQTKTANGEDGYREKKRDGKQKKSKAQSQGQEDDEDAATPSKLNSSEAKSKAAKPVKSKDEKETGGEQDSKDKEAADDADETSSSKRRKRRKKQKEMERQKEISETSKPTEDEPEETIPSPNTKTTKTQPPVAPPAQTAKLTPLQSAMRQKLISSRFRYLNETLYTTPSSSSADLFKSNPTFFTEYHEGFARQVESWPENPVDGFVNLVLSRGSVPDKGYAPGKLKGAEKTRLATAVQRKLDSMGGKEPLPRDFKSRVTTIADLGCGEGSFALQLAPFAAPLHLKVHSFDLAAPGEHVTVADIRALPLQDACVDVAIFSLALMGTNWVEFVEEAWRVLRWKGECWVADVNSRFAGIPAAGRGRVVEHSVGARVKAKKGKGGKLANKTAEEGEEEDEAMVDQEGGQKSTGTGTDVSAFVGVLKRRGFALVGEPDVSNKMFARMRFSKCLPPTKGKNKPREKKKEGGFGRLGKLKFVEKGGEEDEVDVEDERRVLKPCVYKTR